MASSSDSDPYESGRRSRGTGRSLSSRVDTLASTLQDTNRNLRDVDRLLGDYKELGNKKHQSVERLKEDLNRTSEHLKEEKMKRSTSSSSRPLQPSDLDPPPPRRGRRYPTSPLRDYKDKAASDWEYGSSRHGAPPAAAVRFYDDMDCNHAIHQSVRDLTSDQWRMGHDLNTQITRGNRIEHDSREAFRDITASLKQQPATSSSVEQRLKSIQDELRSSKQEELGKISSELKQALESQKVSNQTMRSSEEENILRSRMAQADTNKSLVDDLRRQLIYGEEEKQRLRVKVADLEEQLVSTRKQRQYNEREAEWNEKEKSQLEAEIQDLTMKLTRSATALSEYGDVRKELDRSEKQRSHLSDHIQVVNEELEAKEKYAAKIVTQLQETAGKLQETEKHGHLADKQVEDLSRKVAELSKKSEESTLQLHDTKHKLQESERKREEIKIRAQETVRQWKAKCVRLEQEVSTFKKSTQTGAERAEQLMKELESSRSQSSMSAQQVEHLKREFSQMLAVRAQQEEEIRVKDIQLNELRSLRADLERDLRDTKVVSERMEQEVHNSKDRYNTVLEDRNKLEDQAHSLQSTAIMAQNQCQQMQKEMKELSMMRVELATQLADSANRLQEFKSSLNEAQHGEAAAREELQIQMERSKQEKDTNSNRLQMMRLEFDQYKSEEGRRMQEVSHQHKKQHAEYEARLQAIDIDLKEARAAAKMSKKNTEKLSQELDKLTTDLVRSKEETATMQMRYLEAKEEFITKSHMSEEGLSKAKDTELQLLDLKDALANAQKDYKNMLITIGSQVDSVIEVIAKDSAEVMNSLTVTSSNQDQGSHLLAEIIGKLGWLRSEVREQQETTQQLRGDVRETVHSSENDRQILLTHIDRQHDIMEQINLQKKLMAERVQEIVETEAPPQENQKEREKIQERYSRLQQTMARLREDISTSNLSSQNKRDCKSRSVSPGRRCSVSPGRRRVRISSPPTKGQTRCYSPTCPTNRATSPGQLDSSRSYSPHRSIGSREQSPARSDGILKSTTPPLSLTDEDFLDKFVPKSPQIVK